MTRVAVVAIARPKFDLAEAARQVERAWLTLESSGFEVSGSRELVTSVAGLDVAIDSFVQFRPAVLVVLQATFADASMIIGLHERLGLPLVCWSFPEERTGGALRLNSLCGANLAAYSLRRRHSAAAFLHADPGGCDAPVKISEAIADARARLTVDWPAPDEPPPDDSVDHQEPIAADRIADAVRRTIETLARAPIGVIGEIPAGFEPCAFDPVTIAELTGACTDEVPLNDLFDAADDVDRVELVAIRRRAERDLQLAANLADQGLDRSLRLYGGLRHLAEEHQWKAVATRCWPECARDYGGAVCAPQAMLTADGIPAMCEADVYGALTAVILRSIAGSDPFVTDVVDADRSDGTSAIWHCGQAPVSLADPTVPLRGISHPMQGKALLHEFPLGPGRVTVARLSQAGGRASMVIGGAELVRRPRPFAGTSGVLRWDLPIDDVMHTIFGMGIEHHLAIVAGDHRDVLVALAARWGIPVLRLGHDGGRRRPETTLVAAAGARP